MATELAVARVVPASAAGPLPALLAGYQLFVASNRGPVHYRMDGGRVVPVPATGGLVTALSSLTEHFPVSWISTATSAADRIMSGHLNSHRARPGSPRLRFVDAPDEALQWFYYRFANPILWFLQHNMWDRLLMTDVKRSVTRGWGLGYLPVNNAHARAILSEIEGVPRPMVLVQDYHLYLVPSLLRRSAPHALIHHFTHIPWPAPGYWQPLPAPMRQQLCEGLLGADVAGFQTADSATHFLRCCEHFVPDASVDYDRSTIFYRGRSTLVQAYPISIDPAAVRRIVNDPASETHRERFRPRNGEKLIVRVDRLDPSKNIALGFTAFGRLLERRPDLVGKVRFLAFLVPSRDSIPEYQQYARQVFAEAERINSAFGRDGWRPIELMHQDNRLQALVGMSQADVLLVNPLADGMNLVAKEGPIVSERDLVLVLSNSCGAHRQLGGAAVTVSPQDVEATSHALETALEMPSWERRARLNTIRRLIEREDIRWWAARQMEDLLAAA